jgi:hypothetical protein
MRYIIGLFIAIGLGILLLVLLLGGGKKDAPHAQNKILVDYASSDSQVSMLVDGPINAESEHDQILITVDSGNVTYEHIIGYEGHAVDTKVYENNEEAYDAFLHGLMRIGFTHGDNSPELKDGGGWCPAGNRYYFELTEGDTTIQRYWNTSCNNTKTYLGNTPLTISLFEAQVPDFDKLTKNVRL